MPIIFGVIASEESGHLQPQPPFIDTTSGAVVISGGTTSGSSSTVQVYFTPNPYGQRATNYAITAFSGSPIVAVTGTTVTGTTSPITITYPFAPNGLYEFKGYALNAKGASSYGNQSNQVEPFVATATPSGLSVSTLSTSGVQFTFLPVSGSTSYLLSAYGSYTDPNTQITTTDSASFTLSGSAMTYPTVTGILNHGYFVGMTYEFYVQSQNFAGTSASGANIPLTPNPFGSPKVPVFTATLSGSVNAGINIVVTPDTNTLDNLPTGYNYADSTGGFNNSVSYSGTTWTLINSSNPILPVSTVNVTAKARSPYPDTPGTPVVFKFPPQASPSVISTVTASGSGFNSSTANATITVNWTQPTFNTQYSQPTNYNVVLSGTNGDVYSGTTSYGLNSLAFNNNYYVNTNFTATVVATNSGGKSPVATAGSAVQPYIVAVPGAVTGVTGGAAGTAEFDYQWTPPTSGGPYSNILLYTSPATTTQTVPSGTSQAYFTYNFAQGTSYTFYAAPYNGAGYSAPVSSVTATPYPGFVPITVYTIGAGGGGGWYTGGAAGNLVNGGSAQATKGQTISCVIGAGGSATAVSTATAGTGGNSGATDYGVTVSVIGFGGNGGGPGTTSNRGTGGSNNSWSGGTGVAGAGGGGAGSNGNGSAGAGTTGGNGGPSTPIGPFGTMGPYNVGGGGGGRGTVTQGNTPSQYLPGTGGFSENVGQSGYVAIRWAIADYPGTPTIVGSHAQSTDGVYNYAEWTSTGSITFN